MDRVTVAEAAQRLEVSQDAVYKRIKRGTIPWDKADDGKTVVYIEESNGSTDKSKSSTDESTDRLKTSTDSSVDESTDVLVDELRDRVSFLEEELRRKDTILMSLVQRVPELEPPRDAPAQVTSEPRDPSKSYPEDAVGGDVPPKPQEAPQQRSLLYRFFFGP